MSLLLDIETFFLCLQRLNLKYTIANQGLVVQNLQTQMQLSHGIVWMM